MPRAVVGWIALAVGVVVVPPSSKPSPGALAQGLEAQAQVYDEHVKPDPPEAVTVDAPPLSEIEREALLRDKLEQRERMAGETVIPGGPPHSPRGPER